MQDVKARVIACLPLQEACAYNKCMGALHKRKEHKGCIPAHLRILDRLARLMPSVIGRSHRKCSKPSAFRVKVTRHTWSSGQDGRRQHGVRASMCCQPYCPALPVLAHSANPARPQMQSPPACAGPRERLEQPCKP